MKKVLKQQRITVNNDIATSATYIKGGECITLSTPEDTELSRKLIFPLKVLFEDSYLAVVHKPAGILVSGNSFKTIANALTQNLNPSDLPDPTAPKPVHRLDYATTGVLLVGKTSSAIRALNKLFEAKEVHKAYYAVTIGKMNPKGEINSSIDGKEAKSSYTVIETVSSKRFGVLNLVKLNPLTGRTHQLRKHLSDIGNPILGDKEYGIDPLILKGKGLYLHAHSLEFIHPATKKTMYIQDEWPLRFQKIFTSD